ncbi:hypothetical protein C8Q70DRAFT_517247 [Cubamyces menziesii]|nr:hypothetical protein C8Q70DRAFT_517247 [Cubamyces menziesii]
MAHPGAIPDGEQVDSPVDGGSTSDDGDVESIAGTEGYESDQMKEAGEEAWSGGGARGARQTYDAEDEDDLMKDDSTDDAEEEQQGERYSYSPWQQVWNLGPLPFGYPPWMVPGPNGAMWYHHPGPPPHLQYPHGYPNAFPTSTSVPYPSPGYSNIPPTPHFPPYTTIVDDVELRPRSNSTSHHASGSSQIQEALPPSRLAIIHREDANELGTAEEHAIQRHSKHRKRIRSESDSSSASLTDIPATQTRQSRVRKRIRMRDFRDNPSTRLRRTVALSASHNPMQLLQNPMHGGHRHVTGHYEEHLLDSGLPNQRSGSSQQSPVHVPFSAFSPILPTLTTNSLPTLIPEQAEPAHGQNPSAVDLHHAPAQSGNRSSASVPHTSQSPRRSKSPGLHVPARHPTSPHVSWAECPTDRSSLSHAQANDLRDEDVPPTPVSPKSPGQPAIDVQAIESGPSAIRSQRSRTPSPCAPVIDHPNPGTGSHISTPEPSERRPVPSGPTHDCSPPVNQAPQHSTPRVPASPPHSGTGTCMQGEPCTADVEVGALVDTPHAATQSGLPLDVSPANVPSNGQSRSNTDLDPKGQPHIMETSPAELQQRLLPSNSTYASLTLTPTSEFLHPHMSTHGVLNEGHPLQPERPAMPSTRPLRIEDLLVGNVPYAGPSVDSYPDHAQSLEHTGPSSRRYSLVDVTGASARPTGTPAAQSSAAESLVPCVPQPESTHACVPTPPRQSHPHHPIH